MGTKESVNKIQNSIFKLKKREVKAMEEEISFSSIDYINLAWVEVLNTVTWSS